MALSAIETTGTTYSDAQQLFRDVLPASVDQSVLLVGPSVDLIRAATFVCWHPADSPPLRVLATAEVLRACRDDFSLAARMADLEAHDRMMIHAVDDGHLDVAAVIQEGGLAVVAPTQDGHAIVPAAPGPAHDAIRAQAEQLIRESGEFDLRTPGLEGVRQSLEGALGADTRHTFDDILELVEWEDAGPIDECVICLLAGALTEVQLYELGKWGEDVQLASKATFSRNKTDLEAVDILDAEKEPVSVGRPRLRLVLHESVEDLDLPALVDAAAAATR